MERYYELQVPWDSFHYDAATVRQEQVGLPELSSLATTAAELVSAMDGVQAIVAATNNSIDDRAIAAAARHALAAMVFPADWSADTPMVVGEILIGAARHTGLSTRVVFTSTASPHDLKSQAAELGLPAPQPIPTQRS